MKKLLNCETGEVSNYDTLFDVGVDEKVFTFTFISSHCSMNSYSNKYNDPIYLGDVVEVFLSIGEKDRYFELEVAPNGTMFLAKIYNPGTISGTEYLDEHYISNKITGDSNELTTVIKLDLSEFDFDIKDVKFNAYRIETDGEKPEKYLYALNPTYAHAFHKPEFFIKL